MAFEKGHKLSGSRKGKLNKTTKTVKEIYADILTHEQQFWPDILEQLRKDNPYQYMMVMDKLSNKVVANKKDITSDDKSIIPNVTITEEKTYIKPKADRSD